MFVVEACLQPTSVPQSRKEGRLTGESIEPACFNDHCLQYNRES